MAELSIDRQRSCPQIKTVIFDYFWSVPTIADRVIQAASSSLMRGSAPHRAATAHASSFDISRFASLTTSSPNLMHRRSSPEASTGRVHRPAVIDDGSHLTRDWHVDAVALYQLHYVRPTQQLLQAPSLAFLDLLVESEPG